MVRLMKIAKQEPASSCLIDTAIISMGIFAPGINCGPIVDQNQRLLNKVKISFSKSSREVAEITTNVSNHTKFLFDKKSPRVF